MRVSCDHNSFRRSSQGGFSLLELIVCIALLGIFTAMAIVHVAIKHQETVNEMRFRRNAQELASVCATAQAAGLNFATTSNLDLTIRNIVRGGSPRSGLFKDRNFGLPGLQEEDIQGTKKYLTLANSELYFHFTPIE
jgi:prepilin-type N-terminal cleavage/methylation domain-containing protein